MDTPTTPVPGGDPARDFDFLVGTWRVHNRRLQRRLAGCLDWDVFLATASVRPVWGGAANIDEVTGDAPSDPLHGLTVRLFDPVSQQWRLYWANQTTGVFDPPMVGAFRDGRGEFHDQELFEGRAVFARFIWSDITPVSAHWEQALSEDGGRTWETNWTMDLERIS